MPGCRVGDMAVIIKDDMPAPVKDTGRFVNVLVAISGPEGLPCWGCKAVDGRALWGWRFGFVPWPTWGGVIIPDDWLKPIRGLPLQNKSGTLRPAALGAPREERVCAAANKHEKAPA